MFIITLMCMNTGTNNQVRSKTIVMQMNRSVGSFYSYCCCFDIVLMRVCSEGKSTGFEG